MFRLAAADVAEFAEVSGDRNPQYLDEVHARSTPFGRPIVHGALATIAALAAVPASVVNSTGQLTARFSRPLLTDVNYRVTVKENVVVVHEGDVSVMALELSPGTVASGIAPDVACPEGLRTLADKLGAHDVPDSLLSALAWSSCFVGMKLPSQDVLFSGLRIRTVDGESPYQVKTTDSRTGMVVVQAQYADLDVELRAFQRQPVPRPTKESATRVLAPSDRLSGENVLVVGGSRGIGSHIVSVLVSQGATVWATERAPGSVRALQDEFGSDRVQPLQLDATDADQVRTAFESLEDVRLTGIVLSAGPSVWFSSLHPDNVDSVRDFVDTSLTMALLPLSEALGRLSPGAWLAMVSSGAVEDSPEQRPQYVIAKSAIEALGRYCAGQHELDVLLARAPKMLTDMSNGPLGRMGTVPTEQVASAIVGWVLARPAADRLTVLGPKQLTTWPN